MGWCPASGDFLAALNAAGRLLCSFWFIGKPTFRWPPLTAAVSGGRPWECRRRSEATIPSCHSGNWEAAALIDHAEPFISEHLY
jgi:hypothetical protein